jgi:hypothetical protein
MVYTMDDFRREVGLEELMVRERLAAMSIEERLAGIPLEEIKAYLKRFAKQSPTTAKPKPKRRR